MKMLKISPLLLLALTTIACDSEEESDDGAAQTTGVAVAPPPSAAPTTGATSDTTSATDSTGGANDTGADATPEAAEPATGATGGFINAEAGGLTTGGVSVAADEGGTIVAMTQGTNPGEVCFKGSTPAVTDWTTQWGFSASFELAASGSSYDGTSSSTIDFAVSGTAATLQVGLSDSINKSPAPNSNDTATFWSSAAVGTNSIKIEDLAQPSWTLGDGVEDAEENPYGVKTLDKSQLTLISIQIPALEAANDFDFCITDPIVDGYTGYDSGEEDDTTDDTGTGDGSGAGDGTGTGDGSGAGTTAP
jgi:hypothetical protein